MSWHRKFFLLILVSIWAFATALILHTPANTPVQAQSVTTTPIYDPLAEPLIPTNPSEVDLGRNYYWHYCMPCHGDRGQGLTDEFRSIWEPDHQNCWARGCHSGRYAGDSFPVPTVVPSLVNAGHLAQFSSVQSLMDYLKGTHPPYDPGSFTETQYRDIAVFLFNMNDRLPAEPTPIPTLTTNPKRTRQTQAFPSDIVLILSAVLLAFVLIFSNFRRRAD